jgi:competence protein ComEA
VQEPGVYILEEGARVYEAVEKAGGQSDDADFEMINLAEPLYDGQPVYVPRKSDRDPSQISGGIYRGGLQQVKDGKININSADKSQLETLPGIGAVKAQSIIDYREKNGPFKSVDDLLKVNGIGGKTLESLGDLIMVY